MDFWELILIAIGLSMDAAAVSMTNGMCIKNLGLRHSFLIGGFFGLFQGLMPLIGYFAGFVFAEKISAVDHWIALILLGFIGGKMIVEAITQDEEICPMRKLTIKLVIVQSIATSIDALAVGVSFAALSVNVFTASSIIALITFIISILAVFIGKRFGNILNRKAELVGGIILVGIGAKIFLSHMLA